LDQGCCKLLILLLKNVIGLHENLKRKKLTTFWTARGRNLGWMKFWTPTKWNNCRVYNFANEKLEELIDSEKVKVPSKWRRPRAAGRGPKAAGGCPDRLADAPIGWRSK
jgi:hypothetical protein